MAMIMGRQLVKRLSSVIRCLNDCCYVAFSLPMPRGGAGAGGCEGQSGAGCAGPGHGARLGRGATAHCASNSRFSPRFRCGRAAGGWLRARAAGGGDQKDVLSAASPLPAIRRLARCNQSHDFYCPFVTLAISRLAPSPKASFHSAKRHRKPRASARCD